MAYVINREMHQYETGQIEEILYLPSKHILHVSALSQRLGMSMEAKPTNRLQINLVLSPYLRVCL